MVERDREQFRGNNWAEISGLNEFVCLCTFKEKLVGTAVLTFNIFNRITLAGYTLQAEM